MANIENQENLQIKVKNNKQQIDAMVDKIYPVGSIYMSVNATNPSALFGGTGVKIEGRFLLGSGDDYSLGATGGEAQHTLTIGEMPSHNHTFNDSFYGYPKIDYRINLDSFYTPLYDKIHPSKIPGDNAYIKDSTVNIWKRTA